jgi:hypothetical protein
VTGYDADHGHRRDDKSVAQVEFFVDGVSLVVDTTAPYAATWTSPTPGPHSLTAVATDTASKTTTSTTARYRADPGTTTVTVTGPTGQRRVRPDTITATAGDNIAVAQVEFFVDGVLGVDSTSPYSFPGTPRPSAALAHRTGHRHVQQQPDLGRRRGHGAGRRRRAEARRDPLGSAGGQTSVNLSWGAATDNSSTVAGYVVTRDGVDLPGLVGGTTFTDTGPHRHAVHLHRQGEGPHRQRRPGEQQRPGHDVAGGP